MRRATTFLITLASVVAWAGGTAQAAPPPPAPGTIQITENASDPSMCSFTHVGGNKAVPLGHRATWENNTSRQRSVTEHESLWSFTVRKSASHRATLVWAGTLLEQCDQNGFVDPVRVRPDATVSGSSITVTWALPAASRLLHYSVRYRIGTGVFKVWKRGTAAQSATLRGRTGKRYSFESRVINSGKLSGWSPPRTVRT